MSDDPSCVLTRTLSTASSPILPVDSTWDTPIIAENTESVLFSPSPITDDRQKENPSKNPQNDFLSPKSSTDFQSNTRLRSRNHSEHNVADSYQMKIGRAHV